MTEIDRLALLADLATANCELKHYAGAPPCRAVDYIVLPVGYRDGACEVAVREVAIPVCAECADSLQGDEWTLLYCIECNSSQWIARAKARLKYRHHLIWLRGCPECTNEFGGIYFNDLQNAMEGVVFLKKIA